MSDSFTPGPWSVPHFARDDHSCSCGYILSEHQHGMGAIATVHVSEEGADWRDGDHEPPAVAKANARLIASAPDLLGALEAAVGLWAFRSTDEAQRVWLDMTRAAIARARGQ